MNLFDGDYETYQDVYGSGKVLQQGYELTDEQRNRMWDEMQTAAERKRQRAMGISIDSAIPTETKKEKPISVTLNPSDIVELSGDTEGMDYLRAAGVGAVGIASGIAALVDASGVVDPGTLTRPLDELTQEIIAGMTPSAQKNLSRQWASLDEESVIRNPKAALLQLMQQVPQFAVSFGAAGLGAKLAVQLGKTAAFGGALGGAAAEAGLTGGDAAASVISDIMADESLSKEEKDQLVYDLVGPAAGRSALMAAATGAVPGALYGRILKGAPTPGSTIPGLKGKAARMGVGFAAEAGQEAIQEGYQQFEENVAARTYDPTRELSADVIEAMVAGGALGGIMGGAAGFFARGPAKEKEVPDDVAAALEAKEERDTQQQRVAGQEPFIGLGGPKGEQMDLFKESPPPPFSLQPPPGNVNQFQPGLFGEDVPPTGYIPPEQLQQPERPEISPDQMALPFDGTGPQRELPLGGELPTDIASQPDVDVIPRSSDELSAQMRDFIEGNRGAVYIPKNAFQSEEGRAHIAAWLEAAGENVHGVMDDQGGGLLSRSQDDIASYQGSEFNKQVLHDLLRPYYAPPDLFNVPAPPTQGLTRPFEKPSVSFGQPKEQLTYPEDQPVETVAGPHPGEYKKDRGNWAWSRFNLWDAATQKAAFPGVGATEPSGHKGEYWTPFEPISEEYTRKSPQEARDTERAGDMFVPVEKFDTAPTTAQKDARWRDVQQQRAAGQEPFIGFGGPRGEQAEFDFEPSEKAAEAILSGGKMTPRKKEILADVLDKMLKQTKKERRQQVSRRWKKNLEAAVKANLITKDEQAELLEKFGTVLDRYGQTVGTRPLSKKLLPTEAPVDQIELPMLHGGLDTRTTSPVSTLYTTRGGKKVSIREAIDRAYKDFEGLVRKEKLSEYDADQAVKEILDLTKRMRGMPNLRQQFKRYFNDLVEYVDMYRKGEVSAKDTLRAIDMLLGYGGTEAMTMDADTFAEQAIAKRKSMSEKQYSNLLKSYMDGKISRKYVEDVATVLNQWEDNFEQARVRGILKFLRDVTTEIDTRGREREIAEKVERIRQETPRQRAAAPQQPELAARAESKKYKDTVKWVQREFRLGTEAEAVALTDELFGDNIDRVGQLVHLFPTTKAKPQEEAQPKKRFIGRRLPRDMPMKGQISKEATIDKSMQEAAVITWQFRTRVKALTDAGMAEDAAQRKVEQELLKETKFPKRHGRMLSFLRDKGMTGLFDQIQKDSLALNRIKDVMNVPHGRALNLLEEWQSAGKQSKDGTVVATKAQKNTQIGSIPELHNVLVAIYSGEYTANTLYNAYVAAENMDESVRRTVSWEKVFEDALAYEEKTGGMGGTYTLGAEEMEARAAEKGKRIEKRVEKAAKEGRGLTLKRGRKAKLTKQDVINEVVEEAIEQADVSLGTGSAGDVGTAPTESESREQGGGRTLTKARKDLAERVSREDFDGYLNGDQRDAVNMSLARFNNNPQGGTLLLGDTTGYGKTGVQIAVGAKLADTGGKVLFVLKNKDAVLKHFVREAARMKIDFLDTFDVITYHDLSHGRAKDLFAANNYEGVIWDEAHEIRKPDSLRSMAVKEGLSAKHMLLASATAADMESSLNLFALVKGVTFEDIIHEIGAEIVETYDDGSVEIAPTAGTSHDAMHMNLARMVAALEKEYGYIRRSTPRQSSLATEMLLRKDLDDKASKELLAIEREIQKSMKEASGTGRQTYINDSVVLAERAKLPAILREAIAEVQAGRKVVIMLNTYNEKQITVGGKTYTLDNPIESLRTSLLEAGIKADVFYGSSKTRSGHPKRHEDFQEGDTQVLITTFGKGGASIDMHDTVGNAPRTLLIGGFPATYIELDQALGRIDRRGSKSKPRYKVFYSPEFLGDMRNKHLIEKKERFSRAITNASDFIKGKYQSKLDDFVEVVDDDATHLLVAVKRVDRPTWKTLTNILDTEVKNTVAVEGSKAKQKAAQYDTSGRRYRVLRAEWPRIRSNLATAMAVKDKMLSDPKTDYKYSKLNERTIRDRAIDRGFRKWHEGGQSFTLSAALKDIADKNHSAAPLARKLVELLGAGGDTTWVWWNMSTHPNTAVGVYLADDNTISLSWQYFKDVGNKGVAQTLLHEAVHVVSHRALRTNEKFRREIEKLYDQTLQYALQTKAERYYGLETMDEFIAEIYTNEEFANFLKSIEMPGKQDLFRPRENIFQRFLRAVREFLGLTSPEARTMFDAVMRATEPNLKVGDPAAPTTNPEYTFARVEWEHYTSPQSRSVVERQAEREAWLDLQQGGKQQRLFMTAGALDRSMRAKYGDRTADILSPISNAADTIARYNKEDVTSAARKLLKLPLSTNRQIVKAYRNLFDMEEGNPLVDWFSNINLKNEFANRYKNAAYEVYRTWSKWAARGQEEDVVNTHNTMALSTIYEVWPDRPFDDKDGPNHHLKYTWAKDTDGNWIEHKPRVLAANLKNYNEVVKEYNSLSDKGRATFQEVAAFYKKDWEETRRQIFKNILGSTDFYISKANAKGVQTLRLATEADIQRIADGMVAKDDSVSLDEVVMSKDGSATDKEQTDFLHKELRKVMRAARVRGPYFKLTRHGDIVVEGKKNTRTFVVDNKTINMPEVIKAVQDKIESQYGEREQWQPTHKEAFDTLLRKEVQKALQRKINEEHAALHAENRTLYFEHEYEIADDLENGNHKATLTYSDYVFELHETHGEAEASLEKLKQEGWTDDDLWKGVKVEYYGQTANASKLLSAVRRRLPQKDTKLHNALQQAFIELMPETSIRKAELRRKNRAGWSNDMLRAFAQHVRNSAFYQAQLRFGNQIHDAMDRMEEWQKEGPRQGLLEGENASRVGHVVNELKMRTAMEDVHYEPNFASRRASDTGFLYFLLSPSYSMVNSTQTWLFGLPWLSARRAAGAANDLYGRTKNAPKSATRYMTQAYNAVGGEILRRMKQAKFGFGFVNGRVAPELFDFLEPGTGADGKISLSKHIKDSILASKLERKADVVRLLETLTERNLLTMTFAADMAAAARGENPTLEAAMEWARIMPHLTEVLNRSVMSIAAYEMARDQGASHDQAVDFAEEAVAETQFDYSVQNRSRYMSERGPLGGFARISFMFMQHTQHVYALMLSEFRRMLSSAATKQERVQAAKTFFGVMGAHMVAAGAIGGVFEPAKWALGGAMALAQAFDGEPDEPYDVVMERFLMEAFGPRLGTGFARGLPAALGMDISNRTSIGTMLWWSNGYPKEGREAVTDLAFGLFGPLGSLVGNFAEAEKAWDNGDSMRAIELVTPKLIRDFTKATRIGTEGYIDSYGNRIQDANMLNPFELFVTSLGFNPTTTTQLQQKRKIVQNLDRQYSKERSQLLQRYKRAKRGGETFRAMTDIRAFNRRVPRAYQITADDYRAGAKDQQMRERGMERHGVYVPKTKRELYKAIEHLE